MNRIRAVRARLGIAGTLAAGLLALLVVVAVFAPWLAPHSVEAGNILQAYAPPSGAHWLGTDVNGRDILSRLIVGTRTSLAGPAGVIALSLLVGVPLAMAGAWRGGWLDTVVSRVMDVVFAVPGILLAVLAAAVFQPGLLPAMIAIAISYLPYVARIVRSATLQQRGQPYVAALEVQGAGAVTICVRHILPNISGIVLAQSTLAFGYALADLAALSFLGLAVQAPQPDWGVLVNDPAGMANGHSLQVVVTSVLIIATVASLTLVGDRLAGSEPIVRRRLPRGHRRGRRVVPEVGAGTAGVAAVVATTETAAVHR